MGKNYIQFHYSWDKKELIDKYDLKEEHLEEFKHYLQDSLRYYIGDSCIVDDIANNFKYDKKNNLL